MRTHHLSIDITGYAGAPDTDGSLHTRVSVHLPDEVVRHATVIFGFPGGGYGRGYYDIRAGDGYSQADFHTSRGHIFVACDHLGVGDSSLVDPLSLTYENLAAANHATSISVIDGLRAGTLIDDVAAITIERVVAIGQSMGGCLLVVQQGIHATFDAVALLGWSSLYTNFPAPDGSRLTYPMPPRGTDLRPFADMLASVAPDVEQFRFCFHWADADPALVEADMASYDPDSGVVRGDANLPWGSATVPPCAITMMTEGAVAAEAARISVPVLIACGEIDVVADPWSEPSAYSGSSNVSMLVIAEMAHMHNFAATRARLWHRLENFIADVN